MANSAALATAGEQVVDASQLIAQLGLTEDGTSALATTPEGTPAPTPNVTQPSTAPQKVTVGGKDLTVEQIAQQLQQFDEARPLIEIGQTFAMMTPQQQQVMMDTAEALSRGINPYEDDSRALSVNPLDVPEDAKITHPDWDDLTPEMQYLYAAISGVHEDLLDKLKEVTGIMNGMRQVVGQTVVATQDENVAKALRLLGHTVDAEWVRVMRENGVADVLKAVKGGAIVPPKTAAAPAKVEEAPPEPASVGGNKVINLDTVKATLNELKILGKNGFTFIAKDPRDVEAFYRNVLEQEPPKRSAA